MMRFIRALKLIFGIPKSYFLFLRYFRSNLRDIPFGNIKVKIAPYQFIDPFEFFDYYAVFYAWVSRWFERRKRRLKILDVGGVKIANAILSAKHDITSVVLKDPLDKITDIKYVICDVGDGKLPIYDDFFDVLICPATIHLIGLGRYGDKINPYAIPNFISEINRVMKRENSHIFLATTLGENALIFNIYYIFDFHTYLRLFKGWNLIEYFVDEWSGSSGMVSQQDIKSMGLKYGSNKFSFSIPPIRFSKNVESKKKIGEYKIIFLHFAR